MNNSELFEKTERILAFCVNIMDIITFCGVLIAIVVFIKNRLTKKHLYISVRLSEIKPSFQQGVFFSEIRIDLMNKTNKTFYILNFELQDQDRTFRLIDNIGHGGMSELTCIKIDSYEPKIMYAHIITPNSPDYNFPSKMKLIVNTTVKKFTYKIKFETADKYIFWENRKLSKKKK